VIAVRSALFQVAFHLWMAICGLALLPLMIAPRRWVVRALTVWSRGIMWLMRVICGIRVELRGRENIPLGAALIAPKHQCAFDTFGPFAWLPDVCFVMKKELVWAPIVGMYALKVGAIVVDREGHSGALRKLVRDAKARFRDQRQLVIFPEGTRGEPGKPGVYKPGIAALYRELDLPVHPVATNSGVHWPAHGWLRKPGVIVFEYLEPIPPGLKRAEFMRTLTERIEKGSARLLNL
jgi:1-acyl-sn-glycerol-3-phosphate acyltransferase